MTDAFLEQAERITEQLRAGLLAAQTQGDRASRISSELSSRTISQTSPGQEVTVTVAPSGLLSDVSYSSRAMNLDASTLAALTLTTLGRALARLRDEVDELTAGDDEVASRIRTAYHATLSPAIERFDTGDDLRP